MHPRHVQMRYAPNVLGRSNCAAVSAMISSTSWASCAAVRLAAILWIPIRTCRRALQTCSKQMAAPDGLRAAEWDTG